MLDDDRPTESTPRACVVPAGGRAGAGPSVEPRVSRRWPTPLRSWVDVFGSATIAALVVLVCSGVALSAKGPDWWHETSLGHFVNSLHLWAVELFFLFVVLHIWGKYWMAAWRAGRALTWVLGALAFLLAIPAALTGYLSQQNFDAQWISLQAHDAMNAVGVGAFFNVLDFGQMYGYHVLLMPVAVIALAGLHLRLVRRHGAVPPLQATRRAPTGRVELPDAGVGAAPL